MSFRVDWLDLRAVQGTSRCSTTPQFKTINSSVLSILFGPTLKSIHDYWKNHSFNETELCWHCNVFAFSYAVLVCHRFSSKKQASLISWLQPPSAVILEPKKIVCHCFHSFSVNLPWSDETGCHNLSLVNVRFKPAFSHSLSWRDSVVPLRLLLNSGVICISEIIVICPSHLDSTLCFIHPGVSQDVLCI